MPDNPSSELFSRVRAAAIRILLVVGFFSCIINLLMLVGPVYMLQVYDRVLTSGSVPTLVYLTVAAGGLILVSAFLEGVRARILVRMGGLIDSMLSETLFARLMDRALANSQSRAQPLRDAETVRGFMTGNGLFFFFDAPWTPLFLIVIWLLHPYLFLVAAVGAVILFTVALVSEFATRTPLRSASNQSAGAAAFAEHTLKQAEAVDAMGMMPGLRQRWIEQNRKALLNQVKASDRAGALTAISKFVRPALQVAILGTGASLALVQEITPGAMVAASIIMGRALAPVEGAIGNWRSFVLAREAYKRIRELFEEAGRHVSKQPLRKPVGSVVVEKLVMAPPGVETPVIKGVSFAIPAGEIVGVVGPSASGKSTLARALVGVWQPSTGAVRLDGMSVAHWNSIELGAYLGYLPQDVELLDGTISDNISRFGNGEPDAVIEAATLANVHELILRLPQGYDTQVGPGGAVLSGGQRQRIGLARALYGSPTFIVLDEPNSNLDSEGEAALRQALVRAKENGATVVVIAHRQSVLSIADRLLVLRDGMIEHFGPREEVIADIANASKPAPSHPAMPKVAELRSA